MVDSSLETHPLLELFLLSQGILLLIFIRVLVISILFIPLAELLVILLSVLSLFDLSGFKDSQLLVIEVLALLSVLESADLLSNQAVALLQVNVVLASLDQSEVGTVLLNTLSLLQSLVLLNLPLLIVVLVHGLLTMLVKVLRSDALIVLLIVPRAKVKRVKISS